MDQLKKTIAEKTAILDRYGDQIPPLQDFAKAVGVNSGALICVAVFFFSLILLLLKGFAIAITALTVLYPALQSVRAIESKSTDDDKYWLTYWMVFGFLDVSETFLPFVFYFIPYFQYLKFGAFVWMIFFNGAQTIYESVIKQALNTYRPQINEFLNKIQEGLSAAEMKAKAAMMDP